MFVKFARRTTSNLTLKIKNIQKKSQVLRENMSEDGIQFDLRNLKGLLNMQKPVMGNGLQQFICAANWMWKSKPDYARLVETLNKLIESACKTAGKRTSKAVAKVSIHINGEQSIQAHSRS